MVGENKDICYVTSLYPHSYTIDLLAFYIIIPGD